MSREHLPDDILRNKPAKPSTSVPGHWLLELPERRIYIRRYCAVDQISKDDTAPQPTAGGRKLSSDVVWDKIQDDPLEQAWRSINASGEEPVAQMLSGVCAVIVPPNHNVANVKAEDGNDSGAQTVPSRELWCFSAQEIAPLQDADKLFIADTSNPGTTTVIDITSLISCNQHSITETCLSPLSECETYWATDENLRTIWTYLTAAITEKMACKDGRRIWMLSSRKDILPPYHSDLRLWGLSKLILKLSRTPAPSCKAQRTDNSSRIPRPVILAPLQLPALHLAPFTPSAASIPRLESTFDTVLGISWRSGRQEQRLHARIHGIPWSDYSIYWVPNLPHSDLLSSSTPQEIVHQYISGQGVITMWPTHLALSLAEEALSNQRKRETSSVFGLPSHGDMLGTATGISEVLAAHKEPVKVEETVKESENTEDAGIIDGIDTAGITPITSTGQPDPTESTPAGTGHVNDQEDGKSDIDDLFSDHSSPKDPVAEDSKAPSGPAIAGDPSSKAVLDGAKVGLEELFETRADEPMEIDKDLYTSSPAQVAGMDDFDIDGAGYDATFITEDDFDFFDSPQREQREEVQEFGPVALPVDGPAEDLADEPDPSSVNPESKAEGEDLAEILQTTEQVEQPSDIQPEEQHEEEIERPLAVEVSDDPVEKSVIQKKPSDEEVEPGSNMAVRSSEALAEHIPLPPSPPTEAIPSAFEPLDLGRQEPTLPSLAYQLPSPAPTPEHLRVDLLDRLRPTKKARYDYASAWNIDDEEVSEPDDEEDWSGAPPTPESEDNYDISSRASRVDHQEHRPSTIEAIEFAGITCVTAEWAWLKDDVEAIAALGRNWSNSWVDGCKLTPGAQLPTKAPETLPSLGVLAGIDTDRLAEEILSNRHFRHLLMPTPKRSLTKADVRNTSDVPLTAGYPLSALCSFGDEYDIDDEPIQTAMAPVNVNTGFAGHVMQSNIASLRYWRQLGLSPVGGPKNVSAVVVCNASEDSSSAATRLLRMVKKVYEALHLGKQVALQGEGIEDGVAAVKPAKFSSTLEQMQKTYSDPDNNTVIYVLFNEATAVILPPSLQLLFKSGSASPSCVVHVVSTSAIQSGSIEALAFEVYNRFGRRIRPIESHGHSINTTTAYMQYPNFTIAQDQQPKVKFTLQWPLRSYDMLNKWRFVHGAYAYCPEVSLVVAFVVDSEGDNCEVKTWKLEKQEDVKTRLDRVWDFFAAFGSAAAIEWRISICSWGLLSKAEIDAWKEVPSPKYIPVSLTMVDSVSPIPSPAPYRARPPQANLTAAVINDPSTRIHDESLTAYTTTYSHRIGIPLPSTSAEEVSGTENTIFPLTSFMLSMSQSKNTNDNTTHTYHILSHTSPGRQNDEKRDKLLGREFYKLACLGRLRFGFSDSALPVHLEAVNTMLEGLKTAAGCQNQK